MRQQALTHSRPRRVCARSTAGRTLEVEAMLTQLTHSVASRLHRNPSTKCFHFFPRPQPEALTAPMASPAFNILWDFYLFASGAMLQWNRVFSERLREDTAHAGGQDPDQNRTEEGPLTKEASVFHSVCPLFIFPLDDIQCVDNHRSTK